MTAGLVDGREPGTGLRRPPALLLDGVGKTFGSVRAVADLSFVLQPGTVAGFLGPNGAGKTTTLRMIGGLLRPTTGRILVQGRPSDVPAAREGLGYMPADPTFMPRLTGRANLDLLAGLRGSPAVPDREAAAEALSLSRHSLERRVGEYSSGMRQKLAIVAALQHRPDVVVLDEPANRLDPIAHRAFCTLIRDVANQGRAVLLSSHVLAEVEAVCDTVILLRAGRLLRVAGIDELCRQASRAVTVSYSEPPTRPPGSLTDAQIDGSTVTGRIPARRVDVLRELLADPTVIDVTVEAASLEQVFLDLYSGPAASPEAGPP